MARIVLLGSTGYTGRLTLEAMIRRGVSPVAAGRSRERLRAVLDELSLDLEMAVADVTDPESVHGLLGRGDVLVSTVGPFARWGDPAVDAAVASGAHYLDSNGEPPFTRRIFEHHGPRAAEAGVVLLTAFGWENVAGNLAGALALRKGGDTAVRVDTGYFYLGHTGFSGGTRASFAEAMIQPSFAFRGGELLTVRGAERMRTFPVSARERPALGLGGSEHFAIPRAFPRVREVNAYLGWFGTSRPRVAPLLHRASALGSAPLQSRRVRALLGGALRHMAKGSSGGPTAEERRRARVYVVGIAYDARGTQVAEAHLVGPEGYELTGALLAWGAERAGSGSLSGSGAMGPVEAFGLDELERGCRGLGLAPVS